MPVNQAVFNRKIELYLKGRKRINLLAGNTKKDQEQTIKGLCNGAGLAFLEAIFYDAMNLYYQDPKNEKEDNEKFFELVNHAVDLFFKEIETIIATPDEELVSNALEMKQGDKTLPDWKEANYKLQQAIEEHDERIELNEEKKKFFIEQYQHYFVDGIDTSNKKPYEDYYLHLVNLAENKKVLSTAEAQLLRDNHIPDLPHFERFINRLFLLQATSTVNNIKQYDIPKLFEQLHSGKTNLPLPILENKQVFLLTRDELLEHIEELFPVRRLIRIDFPEHAVCTINTGEGYFYYDSNMENKKFTYCKNSTRLIINLCLSLIKIKLAIEQENIDTNVCIKSFEKELMSENLHQWLNKTKGGSRIQEQVIKKAIEKLYDTQSEEEALKIFLNKLPYLPDIIGMNIISYIHPTEKFYVSYPTQSAMHSSSKTTFNLLEREDFYGENLLMKHISIGNEVGLNLLLEHLQEEKISDVEKEVIINHKNKHGIIPLMNAYIQNNKDVVRLLMKYGANPNTKENTGISTFYIACCESPEESKAGLFYEILPKANVNAVYSAGPVMYLCLLAKNIDHFTALVEKGADVNTKVCCKNAYDATILYHTVLEENFAAFKLLLEKGADPNIPNELGITPLEKAILCNRFEFAWELIKAGALFDAKEMLHDSSLIDYIDPKFEILLKNPDICKEKTLAKQVGKLFANYASLLSLSSLFNSTDQVNKNKAKQIAKILLAREHENDPPEEIESLIKQFSSKKNENNEFNVLVDFVLLDLLPGRVIEMKEIEKNNPIRKLI